MCPTFLNTHVGNGLYVFKEEGANDRFLFYLKAYL